MPISVYQFLYHSYPNNWKYFKYVDVDIYTEIAWTFSLAIAQNEFTQRELRKLDSFKKTLFFLENMLINLKGFPTTWWKIKKAGMSEK